MTSPSYVQLKFLQIFFEFYFIQQFLFSFFKWELFIYLFIYFWLCWVFVSVRGLSLVAASGGHSSSWCAGLSLSRPLLLRSTGSRRAGSVIVAHGPICSAACGVFPDQGSNPCPLHWQADSQPLHHQGSPSSFLLLMYFIHISVYMTVPISQFITPPPAFPLGVHMFVLYIRLYFCLANWFICTIFLDFTIYALIYNIFFLFLTYFTLYDSLYVHPRLYK